jgi:hypothetical protein
MAIIDKKRKIFGRIAAARILTEGLPKLKNSSSFPSINNKGDSILFLTDLIKSLVGFEVLVSALVDTLINSLPKIERDIKQVLKLELKSIVSCGVDPSLPSWFKSTGGGIVIEVKKIDFADILRTDPNSVGGNLIYSDITPVLTDSRDFNTFLYGVIQDDGVTHTWSLQNNLGFLIPLIDITFNSLGTGGNPNNTLTIKANQNYDSKTLTDVNNDFINSLTLFSTENIVNKVMDLIYGSISSAIGKTVKQLTQEAQINEIIDKMVSNVNKNPINDSAFSFSNAENYAQGLSAVNRQIGSTPINVGQTVPSSVPLQSLTSFNQDMSSVTSVLDKTNVLSQNLNSMANISALNVPKISDIPTVKLDFIQQIISNLIKGIVSILLSPKVIFSFVINYKIVYGPNATFTDAIDFIKQNKNLMNSIMRSISEEIIAILLTIALKEISLLAAAEFVKRQKEKATTKLAQLQSLIGVPTDKVKKFLENL